MRGKSVLLHVVCSKPFALIAMYCKLQLSQEKTLGRKYGIFQSHIIMLHMDNLLCGNMASWERMTDMSILHVLYLGYIKHSLLQMKCTLVSDQMETNFYYSRPRILCT